MIRKLEKSHDNVIGYSVAGDVSDEEYRHTASEMRDQIALHGKVRLLFRVSDISPQSFVRALDERFRFAADHKDDIERMAMVTDDTATEWLTRLGGILAPIDVEHFRVDDEDKAWAWLV